MIGQSSGKLNVFDIGTVKANSVIIIVIMCRVLAKLEKKGNDRLSRYYEEFLDMCHIVCSKGSGKPGMKQHRTGTCSCVVSAE